MKDHEGKGKDQLGQERSVQKRCGGKEKAAVLPASTRASKNGNKIKNKRETERERERERERARDHRREGEGERARQS